MKIAAVICEYNPFHKGHEYQLNTIREKLSADYIIALMSGDFVERGEPAIYSKELRTEMALKCGADLVLLLPVSYATGAADLFAYGAVYLLNELKAVDYLVFGSECDDLSLLNKVAEDFKHVDINNEIIKKYMSEGLSFPKARAAMFPQYKSLLDKPNNVLAISYLQALIALNSNIKPYLIKRCGDDYNSEAPSDNATFASATALRKLIKGDNKAELESHVPKNIKDLYFKEKAVTLNDFSELLYYKLLSENKESLSEYLEVSRDLSNKIYNNLSRYRDFESFISELKTKDLTYSRISRALLHLLLNIKGSNDEVKSSLNELQGICVLGFKKEAAPLLKVLKDRSSIMLISKVPAVYSDLNDATKEMLDKELFASTLYDRILNKHIHEYSKKLITL